LEEHYSGWGYIRSESRQIANVLPPMDNGRLIAKAPQMHELLKLALKYLEHPDVQAIPFALPASAVAERIRGLSQS
jgi:hypothetical protein